MSNADQVELVLRVLLAFGFGSLVGLQREFRGSEAGIRTMGSTAMAAAMFTEAAKFAGEDRIAAYVVQGVAVVGAGIIFRGRSGLHGITTAVTMLVVASIGMLTAFELWLSALLATAFMVLALELQFVSDWVYAHRAERGFLFWRLPSQEPDDRSG